MKSERKIKAMIVASLLLMEAFVWTAMSPTDAWSIGIIGGPDGPTAIFLPGNESDPKGEYPAGEKDLEQLAEEEQAEKDRAREQLLKEAHEKGLLILVNKEHPIEDNYKPDDLEKIEYYVSDRSAESRYMRAEAAAAFHQMVDKAAEENLELRMTTAYRSYGFQKLLYENYVNSEGQEAADKFSAKPGRSEHQTGLSVDVSSPSVDYQLSNDFGEMVEGKWLAENAHLFGFIIRFPEGKEEITGYQYEPWHIRYVGLTAAKEIYEQGLTLEEYLQNIKIK